MKMHIALCVLVVTCAIGAAQGPKVSATVHDFRARERRIEAKTQQDYRSAREGLAKEALALAEKEIPTAQAEELLHWIVKGGDNSKTAHNASELLIQHYATSPKSVRNLFSYAINPTGCTPRIFAGFAKASVPEEQRWIVLASMAVHQKSLLLIADEMAADKGSASQWRMRLGRELADRLIEKDRTEFETQVVLDFQTLSEQYGEESIGGMTIKQLSEGSIFAVRHLRLGKTAIGLSGETLDGKMVKIEDFRDRVLLIDFWATWCAPCATAIPDLKKLSGELPSSRFAILGISADEDEHNLRQFIKNNAVQWDNIVDRKSVLQKRWQSLSLPAYFVLDEKGVVRFRGTDHSGAIRAAKSIVGSTATGDASTQSVDEIAKSIFAAYDADRNGRIEKTEFPKNGQAVFEKTDGNKDAAVSLDEMIEFLRDGKVNSEAVEVSPTQQKGDRTTR